ncbi:hypothetical protein D3C75_1018780 [compost metagenome]
MSVFHGMAKHYIGFLEQLYQDLSDAPVEIRLREIVYKNYHYRTGHPALTAFYKRAVQFPPPFFKEVLQEEIKLMEQRSAVFYRAIFDEGMVKGEIRKQQADSLLSAYYCLLDGIAMQMFFYEQEEFERRLKDIWDIFWAGIKQT